MKSFDKYMELKVLEPQIFEAARLMKEADINPEDYLYHFVNGLTENYWSAGAANVGQATGQLATGGLNLAKGVGQLGAGAAQGAWKAGAGVANAVGQSPVGQQVKSWWNDYWSPDNKMKKAATLIQKALSDPIVGRDSNIKLKLNQMLSDLNMYVPVIKKERLAAQNQATGNP